MNTRDDFQLLQVIRKLELFRDLDADEGKTVLGLCGRVTLAAGEIAWRAGDESTHMLVLLTGRLKVVDSEGGHLNDVAPGQVFGEMGVLTGHKRFAGIVALEDSTALSLKRLDLRALIHREPVVYCTILETAVDILSHRLTHTQHRRP